MPNIKHGLTRKGHNISEYGVWRNMKSRCYNEKHKNYLDYGARGIIVCDRWLGWSGFETFISDMGRRPSPKHSLDRIENNGNYEPGNCKWSSKYEQSNNRRSNRYITYNGVTKTVSEWAVVLDVQRGTLQAYLYRNSFEVAYVFYTENRNKMMTGRYKLPRKNSNNEYNEC